MRHLKVKHEMSFEFSFAGVTCAVASFHGKCGPIDA